MVMRLIKKIKRFFFGIHEIIWFFVHGIEEWLYPYRDRPVESLYDEYGDDSVSEINYLKYQIESANERIERLQSEMRYILSHVNLNDDKKTKI